MTKLRLVACGAPLLLLALLGLVAPNAGAWAQQEFLTPHMPYRAFDALPTTDVAVAGGVVHVGFAPGEFALSRSTLLDWIDRSARAVALYYGRFPVRSARLLIVPVDGRGVQGGQAFGYRGAAIRLLVGSQSTDADLNRDWKIVHEMVHLALPDLDGRHTWLSEGLATYVEPIARAQAGGVSDAFVWDQFASDMPKGLPGAGDQGLDFTPTWARTYWGGALFCLLADVELRRRSNNRLGLQDALRGILAAGGNHEVEWPIRRVLAAGDEATGLNVLTRLYDDMRATPVRPDLAALWRELGVKADAGRVGFDDTAALAAARVAITKSMRQRS